MLYVLYTLYMIILIIIILRVQYIVHWTSWIRRTEFLISLQGHWVRYIIEGKSMFLFLIERSYDYYDFVNMKLVRCTIIYIIHIYIYTDIHLYSVLFYCQLN